jgi:hypothetical protein
MWHRVDLVWTDVSEERIASAFRVEKSASEEPAWSGGWSHYHSVSYFDYGNRMYVNANHCRYGTNSTSSEARSIERIHSSSNDFLIWISHLNAENIKFLLGKEKYGSEL